MFSVVNVARFYKLDCEELLHAACRKFIRRFRYLEEGAASRGKKLEDMTLARWRRSISRPATTWRARSP